MSEKYEKVKPTWGYEISRAYNSFMLGMHINLNFKKKTGHVCMYFGPFTIVFGRNYF